MLTMYYFLIKLNVVLIWLGCTQMAYGIFSHKCINGAYKTNNISEGKPVVEVEVLDKNVYVDDRIILICNVRANPGAEIFWLYEGVFLRFTTSPRKRNMYIYSDCNTTLTILASELRDTGRYSCMARNLLGETRSKNVTLAVQLRAKSESLYKDASIEMLPPRSCNSTNKNVTLKCSHNNTRGICVWKKENQTINAENYCDDRMCCLNIRDFSKDDAGAYTCFMYFDVRKATIVIPEPDKDKCMENDMTQSETGNPGNTTGSASKSRSLFNIWLCAVAALIATMSYC